MISYHFQGTDSKAAMIKERVSKVVAQAFLDRRSALQ